ncbi:MAG: N-acetylhexosamine 1-kinase [Verrucomicrobia subdivision 3 bacterium]|nr:N-acetylhexosamine 1-kinase [Limisphaerales bacterium]MCS1415500.1 N-acetylhexosamine 1-kinase [Limisphaerales bacterium]
MSNRAKNAKAEIDICLQHEDILAVILDQLNSGEIPERVTHNDTKFNNIMPGSRYRQSDVCRGARYRDARVGSLRF